MQKWIPLRGAKKASSYGEYLVNKESTLSDISDTAINAPFISNHDMGRAAGYFANDDGTLTKMAGGLYLTMTGNAFIYYGEELGMKGSGRDENKRAPMQWSSDASDPYMTDGPAGMESIEMKYPPLSEQISDPDSIYSYYKSAIRLRNNFPVIARGKTSVDESLSDDDILVISKENDEYDSVSIVYNFSDVAREIDIKDTSLTKIVGSLIAGPVSGDAGNTHAGRRGSRSGSEGDDTSEGSDTSDVSATLKDGKLTVPSHGIIVLQ